MEYNNFNYVLHPLKLLCHRILTAKFHVKLFPLLHFNFKTLPLIARKPIRAHEAKSAIIIGPESAAAFGSKGKGNTLG